MTQATILGATPSPAPDSTVEMDRPRRWWSSVRRGRFGLRTRILLLFTLGALLLAGFLAAAAYSFTRSSLVTQSDDSAVDDATRNAAVAEEELSTSPSSAQGAANRHAVHLVVVHDQDAVALGKGHVQGYSTSVQYLLSVAIASTKLAKVTGLRM